jgi:DNA-binding NarL/FixJ family response regulator
MAMMLQSIISLGTVVLVVARAVNILKWPPGGDGDGQQAERQDQQGDQPIRTVVDEPAESSVGRGDTDDDDDDAELQGLGDGLPDTKCLALSVSDAAEDVIGVIRAGARGYVTKTITREELLDAIRRVHAGDAVFSPRLAGFVLDAFAGSAPVTSDPDMDRLTQREQEVLRLIARGYTYKEVAGRIHVSVKTVETHVSSVLRKLQLSNRHELTAWAADRRLL